jgi:hypothetical protein
MMFLHNGPGFLFRRTHGRRKDPAHHLIGRLDLRGNSQGLDDGSHTPLYHTNFHGGQLVDGRFLECIQHGVNIRRIQQVATLTFPEQFPLEFDRGARILVVDGLATNVPGIGSYASCWCL